MPERIYVFGGTGFLGIRVCRELSSRGYEIYALVRKSSDTTAVRDYVRGFISCDLGDKAGTGALIKELPMSGIKIISMAGSVDYRQDHESSVRANVVPAENLTDLAKLLQKAGRLEKMIYTGSIASRGFLETVDDMTPYLNEDRDCYTKGRSLYCDVKNEAEAIVRKAIAETGLKAVIVEPGSLVGKTISGRSTTNSALIKKIVMGFPVLSGGASYTSADAAARGIVLALEKGAPGETYALGGENMTMKEFALLVKSTGKKYFPGSKISPFPVLTVPHSAALAIGSLGIVVNRQQALMGSAFHYIDSGKASRELGYSHTHVDLEDAVRETIEGIVKGPGNV